MTSFVDDYTGDLAGLNHELQRIVDHEAAAKILSETPTKETIKAWRESAGLTIGALAVGIRMTRKQVSRIEHGHTPVNPHFLKQLRPFVKEVRDGLQKIPTHVTGYPLPPRGQVDRYVPLSQIVDIERVEKRKCGHCGKLLLFFDKRKRYCSPRCKRDAQSAGTTVGVPRNRSNRADAPTQRQTKCEACGHVQTIAGHLVPKPKAVK